MTTADHPTPASDEKRDRIMRAATACLASASFDTVRLRDIAKEAGVSIGMLQHYFDTRELLLAEALEWNSDDLLARWREATANQADPWQRIVALLDALPPGAELHGHCARWTEFCVAAGRYEHLRPGLRRVYKAWQELFFEAVKEGIERGDFVPLMAPADIVDALLAVVDGCELAVASQVGTIDGPRLREVTIRTAAALLSHPG